MAKVRVRMAPTPSGKLHLGTAHTALFNWFFAKHYQGKFVLRIDDSDPKRRQKEYEEDILESLKWLGVSWDEGPDIGGAYGPYRQSERMGRYWQYVERLLKEGKAYYCFCSPQELEKERKKMLAEGRAPKYLGKCRSLTKAQIERLKKQGRKGAVRLKVNPGKVSFIDPSRGKVTVKAEEIGDFVIARADKSALLVTAATIDDHEMKITHTIRGEDYLNFVPRQILLFNALDFKPPVFAHLAFIYGPDGAKLSKRHGAVAVSDYKKEGYLPEALVNYLVLLGWSPKDDREILDIEEVIKLFDLQDVGEAGPRFDLKKLDWMNSVYIRKKSNKELLQLIKPFAPKKMADDLINQTIPLVKDRLRKLADYPGLVDFFMKRPKVPENLVLQKGEDEKMIKSQLAISVRRAEKVKTWQAENLEKVFRELAKENDWHVGKYFMVVRLCLTGKTATPPLFETMEVLGKRESIERLKKAF